MFGALKNAFNALKEKIIGSAKPKDQPKEEPKEMPKVETKRETKPETKVETQKEIQKETHKETQKVEQKVEPEPIVQKPISKPQPQQIHQTKVKEEPIKVVKEEKKEIEAPVEKHIVEQKEEKKEEKREEKVSIITKIKSVFSSSYYLSESDLNRITEELEISFLQADLSIEVTDELLKTLRSKIKKEGLPKDMPLEDGVKEIFIRTIQELLPNSYTSEFFTKQTKKPYTIMFVGTNGTGKTTSIAKLAHFLKKNGKSVVLSASDTYRAASIEQLQGHAEKIGVELIKGKYGQDPASVAFDAIAYAKSKNLDFVLIDTAGRQDTNDGLMKELAKIRRVANPDLVVFVSEALAGQTAIIQAGNFSEITNFDAFALTKVDVDDKGGTLLSIAIGLKKPVIFLGVGQEYKDIAFFDLAFIEKMLEQ